METQIVGMEGLCEISVDYTKNILEMLQDAGITDFNGRTLNYPLEGSGTVRFEACFFKVEVITSDPTSWVRCMDPNNPWQLGKIEHLIAFTKAFPEFDGFPESTRHCKRIYALGSRQNCGRYLHYVPILVTRDNERRVGDYQWGGGTYSEQLFLAVRVKKQ